MFEVLCKNNFSVPLYPMLPQYFYFQNADFATTLKGAIVAGYTVTISGLCCYAGEEVKTQVNFYASITPK
jgi:hypothetical protein